MRYISLYGKERPAEKKFKPSKLRASVADPYHFDTDPDPDPGCEKIRYGSGSRVNFDTDPDPAKKD